LHLLAGHAAAGIDGNPEAHRHAVAAEVRNLHRLVVLVYHEVFSAQTADKTSGDIGDRRRHVDQFDAALELETLLLVLRLAARLAGRLRRLVPVQRHDEQRGAEDRRELGVKAGANTHPLSCARSRRSTWATMRSSVRKPPRYRRTPPAATATVNADSPPGLSD